MRAPPLVQRGWPCIHARFPPRSYAPSSIVPPPHAPSLSAPLWHTARPAACPSRPTTLPHPASLLYISVSTTGATGRWASQQTRPQPAACELSSGPSPPPRAPVSGATSPPFLLSPLSFVSHSIPYHTITSNCLHLHPLRDKLKYVYPPALHAPPLHHARSKEADRRHRPMYLYFDPCTSSTAHGHSAREFITCRIQSQFTLSFP
ncbi:hypothetical protein JB92DRAFT_861968 [Gautieria morchelliformis]|nr:hypothetical protein JB92DRAFT_861968 [Gautieria morchelliformis]